VANVHALASELCDAPYIDEFPYVLECKVSASYDLGEHTLFIGEILDVKAEESLLADGRIDFATLGILTFDQSARAYRLPGQIAGEAFSAGAKFKS